MKSQYLGDSKDSFKWDYHDFLVNELTHPILNVVLMMTPDDQSNEGKSHPTLFPARKEVIEFCEMLKAERDINTIKKLPVKTNSSYKLNLHNYSLNFTNKNRSKYFTGFSQEHNQTILIDPDNGFEPEKTFNEKHIQYSDIVNILEQVSENSVISVFQHHRRKSFVDDFSRIKERLVSGYTTAIYWYALMFVAISKSKTAIVGVGNANIKYAKCNPVQVIP
jgi:hypothetical protein